jgi:hypothetical protein
MSISPNSTRTDKTEFGYVDRFEGGFNAACAACPDFSEYAGYSAQGAYNLVEAHNIKAHGIAHERIPQIKAKRVRPTRKAFLDTWWGPFAVTIPAGAFVLLGVCLWVYEQNPS